MKRHISVTVSMLVMFLGKRHDISRQAEEFIKIFGKLSSREDLKKYEGNAHVAACLSLAKELASGKRAFSKRWYLVRSRKLYRQRKMDDFIFRWILLSGIY